MGLSAWMTSASDSTQVQDGWVQLKVNAQPNDGAQMHYLKVGNGPPLILIHGILGAAFNWRYNLHDLAQTSTVYAVDMLGLGVSERVPGLDASLSATAERMIAFMDALHLDKADFVGTSHGGAVAMLMAARYPTRVGKLVLAAPANPFSTESNTLIHFYRSAIGKWIAPQLSELLPVLPHAMQEMAIGWMYGNPANVSSATLENYMTGLKVPYTADHILNTLDRWYDDMRLLNEAIYQLRQRPILLLWGDHDRSIELASAYQLMAQLPFSRLTILPGAGHLSYEEMPVEFNRAVRSWLERSYAQDAIHLANTGPDAIATGTVASIVAATDTTAAPSSLKNDDTSKNLHAVETKPVNFTTESNTYDMHDIPKTDDKKSQRPGLRIFGRHGLKLAH